MNGGLLKSFLLAWAILNLNFAQAEILLPRFSDRAPLSDLAWIRGESVSHKDFVSPRNDGINRSDIDRILLNPVPTRLEVLSAAEQQLSTFELQMKTGEALGSEGNLTPHQIGEYINSASFQARWRQSTDRARIDAVRYFIQKAKAARSTEDLAFRHSLYEALTATEALATEQLKPANETLDIFRNENLLFPETIQAGRAEAHNVPWSENSSGADPIDTNFWRKPDWNIRDFYLPNYGQKPSRGDEFFDASIPVSLSYKKKTFGGFSPKIRARTLSADGSGKKREFKVKLSVPVGKFSKHILTSFTRAFGSGSEARSETVANQIAASIGYAIQPTYFKNQIYLYFDGKSTFTEVDESRRALIQDLRAPRNFGPTVWSENVEAVFPRAGIAQDRSGRHFLKVSNVALEESPSEDTDFDLGGWSKGGLGRAKLREHRAATILHALFHDSDCKDSNAAVRVRKHAHGYSLYYVLSDLGFAFGGVFVKDMPNLYEWSLVDWSKTRYIRSGDHARLSNLALTYRPYHKIELMRAISFNDARWIVRRLAQLTVDQIEASFLSVKYPKPVAKFFADKVYYRIQELSEALGIAGSHVCSDSPNKPICFSLPRIPQIDKRNYSVSGYESCFKNGELIPCSAVPAEYTLSLSGNVSLERDGDGRLAPQLTWFSEVPRQLWQGLINPFAQNTTF